jgi:hypothetical protein
MINHLVWVIDLRSFSTLEVSGHLIMLGEFVTVVKTSLGEHHDSYTINLNSSTALCAHACTENYLYG